MLKRAILCERAQGQYQGQSYDEATVHSFSPVNFSERRPRYATGPDKSTGNATTRIAISC